MADGTASGHFQPIGKTAICFDNRQQALIVLRQIHP
jgi:hypothetical protein